MHMSKQIVLLFVLSFITAQLYAEQLTLILTKEQMNTWVKEKEECGEIQSESCKKAFYRILTDEQRKFLAVNDLYDKDGNKNEDFDKSEDDKFSFKQVASWNEKAKGCGDPHGEECKRRFISILTEKQKLALGLASDPKSGN